MGHPHAGIAVWRGGRLRGKFSDNDAEWQVRAYEDALLFIWRRHLVVLEDMTPVREDVLLNIEGTYH